MPILKDLKKAFNLSAPDDDFMEGDDMDSGELGDGYGYSDENEYTNMDLEQNSNLGGYSNYASADAITQPVGASYGQGYNNVVNFNQSQNNSQIMSVRPGSINEAKKYALLIKDQRVTVAFTLEDMKKEERGYFISYFQGFAVGINGTVTALNEVTYLVTPENVNILKNALENEEQQADAYQQQVNNDGIY